MQRPAGAAPQDLHQEARVDTDTGAAATVIFWVVVHGPAFGETVATAAQTAKPSSSATEAADEWPDCIQLCFVKHMTSGHC